MSARGEEAPPWSLHDGIDAELWPAAAQTAVESLRQGTLVKSPPLVYAASAEHPIHEVTRSWAKSTSAGTGAVNVVSTERRPPYGLIVTQTCDLVEEGKPKRPWLLIAPVYVLFANPGDRGRIEQGRGFDYLVPVTALESPAGGLWVADLRLLVPAEKGWLVGQEVLAGFTEERGYERLAEQLGRRFSRPAYASSVVEFVLRPTYSLLKAIAERYEGNDPIEEIGLALGRSRLEPVNAKLVFMLDGELQAELRAQIIDWWQPLSESARASDLEFLVPRFVALDELTAREYRELDLLDASALSPDSEEPPEG